jgi:preprotein translocase subunit YajC
MEFNWITIVVIVLLVLIFLIFYFIRNRKDKQELKEDLNYDPPKEGESEVNIEEKDSI